MKFLLNDQNNPHPEWCKQKKQGVSLLQGWGTGAGPAAHGWTHSIDQLHTWEGLSAVNDVIDMTEKKRNVTLAGAKADVRILLQRGTSGEDNGNEMP